MMVIGPGPDPAPNRRPTHVRRHAIPPCTRRYLADLEAVDAPEWAWVYGLEVLAPKTRKEKPS